MKIKILPIIIFSFIFLVGGIALFNSLPKNRQSSLASNPAEIASTIIPTEIPIPITPIETPITIIPTQVSQKSNIKVQVIKATYGPPLGFYPTEFTVKAGFPVRLEVYASENGRGCMGSIAIPDFTSDIQDFTKGQTNVFEFTPITPGEYPIVCAMGIPHGTIFVE